MPIIKTNKEAIIKKTIHLFKVHGYYNTSMADIATASGLLKGSLYHHFKNKEDLALDCLKYIHLYFEDEIFSVAYQDQLSDFDKLETMTHKVEHYFLQSEGGCLLGNFALELSNNIPALKQEIILYFDHWEAALFAIFTPQLGSQQARIQAKEIIATTQGAIMMLRLYGATDQFRTINAAVLKKLS